MFGFFSRGPANPDLLNARLEISLLRRAIREHHDQKADDRCIADDNKLYAAAGLEPADVRIGDPEVMLQNCKRFIQNRCQVGGPWKSYAELEAEIQNAKSAITEALGLCDSTAQWDHIVSVLRSQLSTLREQLDGTECSHDDEEASHQDTLRQLDSMKQLVRNLLNDVADRYKIYRAGQFSCPHMRALAEMVFKNGDVIR